MSVSVSAIPASPTNPAGLSTDRVPQFVCLGFDDNGYSGLPESGHDGGMAWLLDVFARYRNADGSPALGSFYIKTDNLDPGTVEPVALIRAILQRAMHEGHELGSHTLTHPHGVDVDWVKGTRTPAMSVADWKREIDASLLRLAALADPTKGIAAPRVRGFRTPFLEYSRFTFDAVEAAGFAYDSSIEENWQAEVDSRSCYWPYTLHEDSPGEAWSAKTLFNNPPISGGHPGLVELPISACFAPSDEECAKYGVKPGLRQRLKAECPYYDPVANRLTGLDWNFWFEFFMGPEDFSAVLKYTLDERLAGNRAPLIWGGHSDIYSPRYDQSDIGEAGLKRIKAMAAQRREALEDFVAYAVTKPEVRVTRMDNLLDWVLAPKGL